MQIAVTGQNGREVTGHAGGCQRFWLYNIVNGSIHEKRMIEIGISESFHESPAGCPRPLDTVEVLLTGGMGQGLAHRLAQRRIEALVTTETDPDAAVLAYLSGSLPRGEPHVHGGNEGARCGCNDAHCT